MAVMVPVCAYAGDGVATGSDAVCVSVASPSDLFFPEMGSPGSLGGPGLLAGASEDELERYYQSFLDYPVTLLDWPDGVPQPRFMIEALSAAAIYVLEVLAVMVGIYAVGVSLDYLWKIYANYETKLRMEGNGSLLRTWQDVLSAQWGDVISGMGDLYKDFKAYCKGNVNGYATGDGSLLVSGATGAFYKDGPYFDGYPSSFLSGRDYLFSFPTESGVIVDLFHLTRDHVYAYFVKGSSLWFQMVNPTGGYAQLSVDFAYPDGSSGKGFSVTSSWDSFFDDPSAFADALPLPLFDSSDNALNYGKTGDLTGLIKSAGIELAPAKPWADLQWNYYDLAQSVSVPASQKEADGILANAAAAGNAADISKAFESTWQMGDAITGEGTDEDTYSWVPSITGWLEKLAQGIDSIKGWVSSIPDALANIWEGVQALPQSIARALEDVVVGEDDGTYTITESVTGKFPFCVPFDLVGCFRVFQAQAAPPVWRIPFVVDNSFIQIREEIVIDLSDWERPAAVIRFFVLVMFIFGLAYVTRYVVKG